MITYVRVDILLACVLNLLRSEAMDETGIETAEPIFELATKCESLFSEHISRLRNESDLNGAKVVGEYQQAPVSAPEEERGDVLGLGCFLRCICRARYVPRP